jgi:hypothetical protein
MNASSSIPIEARIADFVLKNKPKLFILTPCYGGMCHVNYLCGIMNTIELFRKINIPLQIEFCKNDSLVSRARNNLVAKAMNDPNMTHILFIDSDISWDPYDILKLLLCEKSLVGGVYPMKHYFWEKLVQNKDATKTPIEEWIDRKNNNEVLSKYISDTDMIQYNLLKYNINYKDPFMKIESNLAEVRHLANGFMMIQRQTIESMMLSFPSTKYIDDVSFLVGDENKFAYALFDCGVEDGHYFSEDWLFCHRWSQMGGKIYVDVTICLTHTGSEDFRGNFLSSILT